MTNWVVGKQYKSVAGATYEYVGPFTKSDGRPGAAFVCRQGSVLGNLCARNADGTTDYATRELDILDGTPTKGERDLVVRLLYATGIFGNKTCVAADHVHAWNWSESMYPKRDQERAEALLEIIREIKGQ